MWRGTCLPYSGRVIFVSNIVSFVLGLVSAFLIDHYRDRKNARRELSREVYGPLHFELTTHILENVARHGRSGCGDHTWQLARDRPGRLGWRRGS